MMQSALLTRMGQQQPPLLADDTNSSHSAASGEATASNSSTGEPLPPPAKKKRSLPGNPDPDAEVIALSPNSLLTTNRFLCEICHKGFQRDQNLQLHRRGHNLPWKLKQRSTTEPARKKVYVCPEESCVHHNPSRALGDLTGIKKHFSRKHGEKKWRCNKCSRSYAVQSDWKAHAKICGTKEYLCDCGATFTRRDSFVTHKAFCNILAEEAARAISNNPLVPVTQQQAPDLHQSPAGNLFNLQNPDHLIEQDNPQQTQNSFPLAPSTLLFSQELLQQNTAAHVFSGSSALALPAQPPMSATALLQKAAQMGAIISSRETSTTTGFFNQGITAPLGGVNGGGADIASTSASALIRDIMMNSLPSFDGENPFGNGGSGELTRDFLGLKPLSNGDIILNMATPGDHANYASAAAASSSQGHNHNNSN